MLIADVPTFVPSLPSQVTGVDFLGLAAVNERYVALALPGISNVTRYMRVYSVMSWLAWRFGQHLRAATTGGSVSEKEIADSFRRFREKVELLFVLGNTGFPQVAGQSRGSFLQNGSAEFALEFQRFGEYKISLLDAAVYGPSLGTESGLGFIDRAPGRSYRPGAYGDEMAAALDESLRHSDCYGALVNVQRNRGSRAMIDGLATRWAVRKSTARERACFRKAFVRDDCGPEGTTLRANRAAMVRLIIAALKAMGGQGTVVDVREAIACGFTRNGEPIDSKDSARTQGLWSVLQLRQLQRLALEALLRWVELALIQLPPRLRDRSPDALAALASIQTAEGLGVEPSKTVEAVLQKVCLPTARDSYFVEGLKEPYVDPFEMLRKLLAMENVQGDFATLPSSAVAALCLCAGETVKMAQREHCAPWIDVGRKTRISLKSLASIFEDYREEPLDSFVRYLIESLVIGQHFAVTNSKLEPNKNKYRFIPDTDGGLRALIRPNQVTRLAVTGDRLENAMQLMADCDLLGWDEESGLFEAH